VLSVKIQENILKTWSESGHLQDMVDRKTLYFGNNIIVEEIYNLLKDYSIRKSRKKIIS